MERLFYLPLALVAIGLGISLSDAAFGADESSARLPNILLITADNLGYGDLPCYNPDSRIQAPHLDRLAKSGAKFTSFYTASPTCTVSRACLMTGRIPQRHGLDFQLPGLEGNYGEGLSQREVLMPEILKTTKPAYATACFGKWNIGFAEGSRPTERGFDEFIGHASGNMDYYTHNYNGKHDLYEGTRELHREGVYSTDLFADSAIDFIRRQSSKANPWFCYLPFNAPHFPNARNKAPGEPNEWQAPKWAFETYGLSPEETEPVKRYRAVVTALDAAVGRVLKSLDDLQIADDTFVFFYSDNGAFRLGRDGLDVGSNFPLRSGGVTCWEGGLRVVAMARWPGKISEGVTISEPCWSPDLLTTFATLTAAKLPRDVVYDGKDILPVLTDNANSPHESLYFRYRNHAAVRKGPWKIVRENPKNAWQLFNLESDPSEMQNLADDKPDVVRDLQTELRKWEQSF